MISKTSELNGAALDWAVARAKGNVRLQIHEKEGLVIRNVLGWIPYRPSVAWEQGGPIIEQELITVRLLGKNINGPLWDAICQHDITCEEGPTPLIAAMRCYVASKLGSEIEVPDELIKEPA